MYTVNLNVIKIILNKALRPVHAYNLNSRLACANLMGVHTLQVSTRKLQFIWWSCWHRSCLKTRTVSIFLLPRAQKTTKQATGLKTRHERWSQGAYLTVRSSLRGFNIWHVEGCAGRSYSLARCTVFVFIRTLLSAQTELRRQVCSEVCTCERAFRAWAQLWCN